MESSEECASVSLLQPSLSEPQCQLVLTVALSQAHCNGIRPEDSEDQASAFLLHLLAYMKDHPHVNSSMVLSPAWLARSAGNWMKSFRRAERRQTDPEPACSDGSGTDLDTTLLELPSNAPLPFTEALRAEFCERIDGAIAAARLTEVQYELLVGLREEEGLADIARRLQCRPEAVRQRIRRTRVRLSKVFRACGLGQEEIQDYLSALRPAKPARHK